MKKKVLYLSILMVLIISTTGCLKFNATMKVNKDKSFDFSIITAIDKNYFGEQEVFTEEKKKEIRKKGFDVTDYQEGNMVGVNINRKIKNIDLVSSTNDIKFNLSEILDSKSNKITIFKVKKGFFKNRYIANINLETPSDLSSSSNEQNKEIDFSNLMNTEDNNKNDLDPNFLQSAITNIDLSFKVILPYPAKEHNATNVSNNNKELSWNLTTANQEPIEFEFELYNRRNIYIAAAIIIILIMFIISNNKQPSKQQPIQEEKTDIDQISETPKQDTNIEQVKDIQIKEISEPIQQEVQNNPTLIQQMYQSSSQQPESNVSSTNQDNSNNP